MDLMHKKSMIFGFLSFALPSIILLASFPIVLTSLNDDAFGVYMLAIGVPGLITIVDLGLFATITKFIAQDFSNGDLKNASEVWSSAMLFYFCLSLVASFVLFVSAHWIVNVMNTPAELREAGLASFEFAALMLPFIIISNVIVSALKGFNRFDLVMVFQIAQSLLLYLIPALWILFDKGGVESIMRITFMLSTSLLILAFYLSIIVKRNTQIFWICRFSPKIVYKRLLSFGIIITLSGIITSIVVQLSRYLVGWILGPAAAGQFSIVFTLSSKIQSFVNSFSEFIFPVSSSSSVEKVIPVYKKIRLLGVMASFLSILPIIFFSEEILSIWLGYEVDPSLGEALKVFSIATFFASLGTTPYHLLNGFGYPLWNVWLLLSHLIILSFGTIPLIYYSNFSLISFGYVFIVSNFLLALFYYASVNRMFKLEAGFKST